jgi:hypothetical protein
MSANVRNKTIGFASLAPATTPNHRSRGLLISSEHISLSSPATYDGPVNRAPLLSLASALWCCVAVAIFLGGPEAWMLLWLFVPYVALLLAGVFRGYSEREIEYRKICGQCLHCGYNLRGNVSGTCPECGRSTAASDQKTLKARTP